MSIYISATANTTEHLARCKNCGKEDILMKKLFVKAQNALARKNGESYVDTIVKIIICVVVGALVLGGIYALAKSGMDRATEETSKLFEYSGD